MSLLARLLAKSRPVSPAKAPLEHPAARPAAEKAQAAEAAQAARARQAAHDEEELQAALASLDSARLGALVLKGSSTRVRQQAASAITDVEQLRALIKEVRGGNDKSVYKILQSKREQLLAEQRRREQQRAEIAAVAAALERHSHRPYDPLFGPALEQLSARWQAVAADAEAALAEEAQAAIARAREVITQHDEEARLAARLREEAENAAAEARRQREEAHKAAAAEAAEQARVREELQREAAARKEAQDTYLRQVAGLIRKAQGALSAGGTSRAAGVRRALEEKLAAATVQPLPAHLTVQLQALDKRLNEMKDWKSFSVAPKRTELIESMEALVGAQVEPQQLAERIRSLQEQWRTLSRGAGENAEEEWQRFHAAAQKAYEPCREHFAAQAQGRQENLRQREALADQLAAFEAAQDWEQPEWRAAITTLREIKEQWRRASPVERAAGAAVKERFEALTGAIQARIDAEYARNVEKKKALIAAAERARSEDDSRRATDEVKELQRRWKEVGPVPRALDQSLWEELRRHCDAVFEKREQGRVVLAAGLEAKRTQAAALAEEVEEMAKLTGGDLLSQAQGLSGRRAAFEALGELPRQHARELQRRFERALERVEAALEHQRALDTERSWVDVLQAAGHVQAYHAARARGLPAEELVALNTAAESHIASLGRLPKGALDALKKALARKDAGDLVAGEAALRQLCIRAEVAVGLPSPEEDNALRRDYQVQRLMHGMGQGIEAQDGQLDELTLDWVGAGPASESVYPLLLARFTRCRQEHLERAAS
jgi:hypothetical protein